MSLDAWSSRVLSLMRFVAGLLFLMHGTQKLLGWPARANAGPEFFSQMGLGGMIEIVGGTLIMIGLFTRPAAFICSGMMAVAYFQFHAPGNFFPILNRGEGAILFCFVFFYLVFAGPGPWSLDAKRK
ncbi:DoxX family protein [Roseococcus sp. SYP-B2431]|uniref:DoxX family protein n=1 Tax=Roseococcus sp. SYP-B2431 TaxID=2496640 RepID=UPI00103F7FBE|nr:DoxX family protein [Roseococcus sp. SYP-B2431]TCH99778.1 DoxX family protein [Roseococcus sp. SYP-B2431]